MVNDAYRYLSDGANWSGADGIWAQLVQQLLVSITALAIAAAIGLPIALTLGHLGRGGFLAVNISNVGRAIPTFALLVLFSVGPLGTGELGPYGRAGLATLVALTLFALPPIITNSYVGVREVDREVVDAARGMGMSGTQLFFRVELPLSVPLVVTGLRLALVQVWATATIAALVNGPGLGTIITAGFFNANYGKGLAGAIIVAIVAMMLEGAAAVVDRAVDPRRRADRHNSASLVAQPAR